jgi:hypothetical protein
MDPNDTESIASGIQKILADGELQWSLSAKGLERSALFTWDLCARKTLALLEKVAASEFPCKILTSIKGKAWSLSSRRTWTMKRWLVVG